ncbi:hypothetical protein MTO96_005931 [Rhipicephalus appendiculatus]
MAQSQGRQIGAALTARPILLCCIFLVVVAVVSATSVLVTLYAKDSLRIRCLPGPVQVEVTPSASALGNFSQWAVSTDAAPCTSVARRIFKKGGKTVDAAIATLLSKKDAQVLVAREVAPAAASTDMYVKNKKGSLFGGLAIAVPGELRGYYELHRHLNGALPWKELFTDAIRLARDGYPMGAHLANALRESQNADNVLKENIRKTFSNPETGELLAEGELVTLKDLAQTLELIAEYGPDYFYEGEFAEKLVSEVQNNGGILTMEDLKNYQVKWEKPVTARFKGGMTLYSAPPPASGAVLAYILGIMDAFRPSPGSFLDDTVTTLHRFAEACKFAYAKRARLGDPSFVNCEQLVQNMSSRAFAADARYKIDDERTTVNYYFGSMLRTSAGVVMNNQMDDFSTPGMRNFYGVAPSAANFIVPGKRPMSSMAPVVVVDENGDVQLALGGTGGAKITSGVALVVMRTLWQRNSIKAAIDYPRLHHQLIPNHLMVESFFPKAYVEELRKLGHKVTYPKGRFSIMMGVNKQNGRLFANSDFRKGGTVDGI